MKRNNKINKGAQIISFYAQNLSCVVSLSAVHATEALCENVNEYISFSFKKDLIRRNKTKFYEIARFPNVIGLIDGTQIPVKAPSMEGHLYVKRISFNKCPNSVCC